MSVSQEQRVPINPPESAAPAHIIAKFLSSPAWRPISSEDVELDAALGRVLSADFRSPYALPARPHAAVDGYAIRSSELSESVLRFSSSPRNGRRALQSVRRGEAIMVLAGSVLPPGCDTVIPTALASVTTGVLRVTPEFARGSSVIAVGSDIEANEVVMSAGSTLSIADIGTLAAFGLSRISVRIRPTVALITTDHGIAPQGESSHPGQDYNVGRYVLSAALTEWGARVLPLRAHSENIHGIFDALSLALSHVDAIIVASDPPPNQRSETANAIEAVLGGTIVSEGVCMKPGANTVLGVANGIPIIGIPGASVAALLTLRVICEPVVRRLSGRTNSPRAISCILQKPISADRDVETNVLVHVAGRKCFPIEPSTLRSAPFAEANGFVRVPASSGPLRAAAEVLVESLDGRRYGMS